MVLFCFLFLLLFQSVESLQCRKALTCQLIWNNFPLRRAVCILPSCIIFCTVYNKEVCFQFTRCLTPASFLPSSGLVVKPAEPHPPIPHHPLSPPLSCLALTNRLGSWESFCANCSLATSQTLAKHLIQDSRRQRFSQLVASQHTPSPWTHVLPPNP